MKNVIYYRDELNDDFDQNSIKVKNLSKYKYAYKSKVMIILSYMLYYILAVPILFVINYIIHRNKFINRKVFKQTKGSYFIYSNHTAMLNDAIAPALSNIRKKAYIICNEDALSIPCCQNIVKMIGGVPLIKTLDGTKKLNRFIDELMKKPNNTLTIYPEAHIWPYHTKIRPFKYNSFKYPARLGVDSYVLVHCYKKTRLRKKPKTISIAAGPFKPDMSLPLDERSRKLRDDCHNKMVEIATKYSTYEYITYIKEE